MGIKITALSKEFPPQRVLTDLDADLKAKDITVIIGKNGSGKSTLLNCIGGLLPFERGYIDVSIGTSLSYKIESGNQGDISLEARKKIGYIFQQKVLWNHLSVIDNLVHPLVKVQRHGRKEAVEKAKKYLDLLKIMNGIQKSYPGQLSGGQQRKVAIARTLAMEPDLLLIDELEANLDQSSLKLVMDILKTQYIDNDKTVLIVSHSIDLLEQFTPNIILLNDGRVIESAKGAKELLTKDQTDIKKIKVIKDTIDSSTSRWFLANQCLEAAIQISQVSLKEKDVNVLFNNLGKIVSGLIQKFEPDADHLLLIATKAKGSGEPSEVRIRCAEKTDGFYLNGDQASSLGGIVQNLRVKEGRRVYEFIPDAAAYMREHGGLALQQGKPKTEPSTGNSLMDLMFMTNGSNLEYQYSDRHDPIEGVYNIMIPIPEDKGKLERKLERESYYDFSKQTKNVYLIGCIVQDEVKGIISIDITAENKWSDFIVQQLKLIGNMIAIAIKDHEKQI